MAKERFFYPQNQGIFIIHHWAVSIRSTIPQSPKIARSIAKKYCPGPAGHDRFREKCTTPLWRFRGDKRNLIRRLARTKDPLPLAPFNRKINLPYHIWDTSFSEWLCIGLFILTWIEIFRILKTWLFFHIRFNLSTWPLTFWKKYAKKLPKMPV